MSSPASSTTASSVSPASSTLAPLPVAPASSSSSSSSSLPIRRSGTSNQWDRCLENGAIKTAYGAVAGGLTSLILFRSSGARFITTGFAAGIGAGMSVFECQQAYAPTRFQNTLLTPAQNAAVGAAQAALPRCGRASCKCGANCKCTPAGFASVSNGVLPTFKVDDKGCCSK